MIVYSGKSVATKISIMEVKGLIINYYETMVAFSGYPKNYV